MQLYVKSQLFCTPAINAPDEVNFTKYIHSIFGAGN